MRTPRQLATQVVEESSALGGDRIPHLGCLRNPLHQLLDLVTCQQATPHSVSHLALDRPVECPLDGRAVQRLFDRLLEDRSLKDARQRAFRPPALDRAHNRLLCERLRRTLDAGHARNPPRPAGSAPNQTGRKRSLIGGLSRVRPLTRYPRTALPICHLRLSVSATEADATTGPTPQIRRYWACRWWRRTSRRCAGSDAPGSYQPVKPTSLKRDGQRMPVPAWANLRRGWQPLTPPF